MKNSPEQNHTKRGIPAFTLIEVMTASLILSGVFFAILSLVSNSTRQANMLDRVQTMNELSLSAQACIKSLGYTSLAGISGTASLNFGTDNLSCATGSYDSTLSFSGIDIGYSYSEGTGSITYWSYFIVNPENENLQITHTVTDGVNKRESSFLVGR